MGIVDKIFGKKKINETGINPVVTPTPATAEFKPMQLCTKEGPLQILTEDFPKHQWPISGGWGYSQENAVVLELDNEFSGVMFEQKFVEYRTYEELIVFRPKAERYAGIRIKKGLQALSHANGKSYDMVEYEVTAYRESDYEMLKADWEKHNAYEGDEEGRARHLALADSLRISYNTVGWFDITRFFGK